MKNYLFSLPVCGLFSLVVMAASPAFAANEPVSDAMSPSMAVGKIMCERLYITHKPDADVAYQPGVDVNGNAVVPADIAPPINVVPDFMEVPMTMDLAKVMQVTLPAGAEMDAQLGTLRLHKGGKVEYNGQDITENASHFCGTNLPDGTDHIPNMPEPEAEKVVPPASGSVAPSATMTQQQAEPTMELPRGTVNVTR